jgi:hypothetical protein
MGHKYKRPLLIPEVKAGRTGESGYQSRRLPGREVQTSWEHGKILLALEGDGQVGQTDTGEECHGTGIDGMDRASFLWSQSDTSRRRECQWMSRVMPERDGIAYLDKERNEFLGHGWVESGILCHDVGIYQGGCAVCLQWDAPAGRYPSWPKYNDISVFLKPRNRQHRRSSGRSRCLILTVKYWQG